MTARIRKDMAFITGVHFENTFMINLYECDLSMIVHTDDNREQRIALDRVFHFVNNHLNNSIIIASSEKDAIEKYEAAGHNLCIIPEEPYDQLLGLILLNKFNSIMEGRLQITDMTFGSKLTDYIKFEINHEDAEELYSGNAWYNNSNVAIKDVPKKKRDKVVKLFEPDEWEKHELTWKEKKS
jgi:hypothetical protein